MGRIFRLVAGHVAWHLPGVVVGVQEMVGFLAHWFAEIESVEIEMSGFS